VATGVNESMFNSAVDILFAVPIDVGAATHFVGTFTDSGVTNKITIDFFAWTPGMATFTGLTTKGVALPTVMAVGSFNLTGGGAGSVTLVSPSKISIDGALMQRR